MREGIMNGKLFTDECEGLPAERTAAKIKMKSFNMIILSMQKHFSYIETKQTATICNE